MNKRIIDPLLKSRGFVKDRKNIIIKFNTIYLYRYNTIHIFVSYYFLCVIFYENKCYNGIKRPRIIWRNN